MPWRVADRYSISMMCGFINWRRVGYIYTSWYERMTAQKEAISAEVYGRAILECVGEGTA